MDGPASAQAGGGRRAMGFADVRGGFFFCWDSGREQEASDYGSVMRPIGLRGGTTTTVLGLEDRS